MTHAWGDNRILTYLKEGRKLYSELAIGKKPIGPFPLQDLLAVGLVKFVIFFAPTVFFLIQTMTQRKHLLKLMRLFPGFER